MGLDIDIYKRNTEKNCGEIGDDLYGFCKNCWNLLTFLQTLDNSNYFTEFSFSIIRLNVQQVEELKEWLKSNRANDWQYDECLSILEGYNGELIIKADW